MGFVLNMKILSVVLSLFISNLNKTNSFSDEVLCNNYDRLTTISRAIEIATRKNLCSEDNDDPTKCWDESPDKLAVSLAVLAFFETTYSKRIQSGKCFANECDPVFRFDSRGNQYTAYHRARSMWQIHFNQFMMSRNEWRLMVGNSLESISTSATIAGRIFTYSRNRCNTDMGGFALYGTGKFCTMKIGVNRVHTTNKFVEKIKDHDWILSTLEKTDVCI